MSIKSSKNSLAKLLADNGDDDLVSHNKTKTILQESAVDVAEDVIQSPEVMTVFSGALIPKEALSLAPPSAGTKPYRSQGLTIYESDDDLVDGFIDYLRKKKLRMGRKKGFSLFARAGLRALEDLRVHNPIEFEELLSRAILEQK
jgi:hypothetical protein